MKLRVVYQFLILELFISSCHHKEKEKPINKKFTAGLTVFGNLDDPTFSYFLSSDTNINRDTLYCKTYLKYGNTFYSKVLKNDSNFTQKIVISKFKSDSIRSFIINIISSPVTIEDREIKDGTKFNFFYRCGNESISHSFIGSDDINSQDFKVLLSLLDFKLN